MPEQMKQFMIWAAQAVVYGLVVALYKKYDNDLKRKTEEIKDLQDDLAEIRDSVTTHTGQLKSFETLSANLQKSIGSLETRIDNISANMVTKQDIALLVSVLTTKKD